MSDNEEVNGNRNGHHAQGSRTLSRILREGVLFLFN